jgi:XRE family transcriptional regulator, regulator of sulfur utilization
VREGLGLSREGLADRAGVSLRTIERIEGNKTTPRRATLKVLADALGVDPADLVGEARVVSA